MKETNVEYNVLQTSTCERCLDGESKNDCWIKYCKFKKEMSEKY